MSANNYYEVINTKMYISHCCMCQETKSKNYPRVKMKELLTCLSLLKTICQICIILQLRRQKLSKGDLAKLHQLINCFLSMLENGTLRCKCCGSELIKIFSEINSKT